jgi:hypothetical protein
MNKKTAKKTTKPGRRAIKRETPGQAGGIDLLRIADKVGLQQYAAEGFRDRQTRAMAALTRMMEREGDKADVPMDELILRLQFIREMAGMSSEEIFAGIDSLAEETAWEDRELDRLSAAITVKRKKYGLKDDEDWIDGEAPEDTAGLLTAWEDRLRQLKVAILRHHSENEMADLLANDPGAYADRVEKGRKIFEDNHAAGKYEGKAQDEKAK